MIKANELRIGNETSRGTVISIYTESLHSVYCKDSNDGITRMFKIEEVSPIPLNEEWMINFGFKPMGDEYWYNNCVKIPIEEKRFGGTMLLTPYRGYVNELKHVHQLQNLYFALTNEELILKQ